jgi:hypothetical protein
MGYQKYLGVRWRGVRELLGVDVERREIHVHEVEGVPCGLKGVGNA